MCANIKSFFFQILKKKSKNNTDLLAKRVNGHNPTQQPQDNFKFAMDFDNNEVVSPRSNIHKVITALPNNHKCHSRFFRQKDPRECTLPTPPHSHIFIGKKKERHQ